jgi:hypothetical protein
MGLDMYAYATAEKLASAVDFEEPENSDKLHYWRKHPDLHGWMEELYVEKGGNDPDFNLSPVMLNSADLDRLEAAVTGKKLPDTEGFFFGVSKGSEVHDDLSFIAKARESIASGKSVYYVAWW